MLGVGLWDHTTVKVKVISDDYHLLVCMVFTKRLPCSINMSSRTHMHITRTGQHEADSTVLIKEEEKTDGGSSDLKAF